VIIVGIDYSMTSPSICVHSGDAWSFDNCEFHFRNDNKKLQSSGRFHHYGIEFYSSQEERFYQSAEWARKVLKPYKIDLLVLEGYAMGAKGLIFNIAENTGALKRMFWEEGIKFITPAPTTVKKFFQGKGNANKEAMEAAFLAETSVDVKPIINQTKGSNPSSDIIDSYAMAKFGFFQPKMLVERV
jgi:Holliday junction resolvasome RuvABC endonuclease subunit